jgi:hypothetical protein
MTETAVVQQGGWIALILLCVAEFVVIRDASIVNGPVPTIALPSAVPALGVSEPI